MPIFARTTLLRRLALGAVFACLVPGAGFAQTGERAPNWLEQRVQGLERSLSFFGGKEDRPAPPQYAQPAQSSMADITVRLDRLENQMRQLNGRIDEMQFQGRKNEEGLKRLQGDIDFRLQELESGKGGGGSAAKSNTRRGDAGDSGGGSSSSSSGSTASIDSRDGGGSSGGGLAAPPTNLGQTRPTGGDAIGGLIDDDPNAPMSIRPPGVASGAGGGTGSRGDGGYGGPSSGGGDRMAARGDDAQGGVTAGAGGPNDQFALGVGFVQRRDYDQAEATFRDFLRSHPNDAKAPEARYWLGESLYQRKKYTDAADSFFTIYKDAPQSSKAPESMLKLGMSLNGMGKKEEACATIAEAGKKYSRIKAQSDRELKRISC